MEPLDSWNGCCPYGGVCAFAPRAQSASASWTHDPDRPVPSIGANVTGFYEWVRVPDTLNRSYIPPRARMQSVIPDGPMHQRERPDLVACLPPFPLLSQRPDVIVFETAPLERGIEVTGGVDVRLWVSSTALDTDFTAKLPEISPPTEDSPEGYHLPLCDSILRGRFRNGFDREELMTPGRVYEIRIPLPPISNLFVRGHRIRLDIASSNFPRFDINPNTGEPLGRHTHKAAAQNTVYFDRRRPSQVILPVIRQAGRPG